MFISSSIHLRFDYYHSYFDLNLEINYHIGKYAYCIIIWWRTYLLRIGSFCILLVVILDLLFMRYFYVHILSNWYLSCRFVVYKLLYRYFIRFIIVIHSIDIHSFVYLNFIRICFLSYPIFGKYLKNIRI